MTFLKRSSKKRSNSKRESTSSLVVEGLTPTKGNKEPASSQSTPGVFISHSTPMSDRKKMRAVSDVNHTNEPDNSLHATDNLEIPFVNRSQSLRLKQNNGSQVSAIMSTKISPLRNQRNSHSFLNLSRRKSQDNDDLGDSDEEDDYDIDDIGSALSFNADHSNHVEPGAVRVPLIRDQISRPETNDTNEDSVSDSGRPSLENKQTTNALTTHLDVEEHMANAQSTIKNDSGILSSFIHAAQSAANTIGNITVARHDNDIKPHPPSSGNNENNGSSLNFMQHLDTLLFNQPSTSKLRTNSLQVDTEGTPQAEVVNDQASLSSNPKSLAHDIVFHPIRKTAISTMGQGELTLEDLGFSETSMKLPAQELALNTSQQMSPPIPSIDISAPTPVAMKSGTVLPLVNGGSSPKLAFDEHQFPNSGPLLPTNGQSVPKLSLDGSVKANTDLDSKQNAIGSSVASYRRSLSPNGTIRRERVSTLPVPVDAPRRMHRRSMSSDNSADITSVTNGPLSNQVSRDAEGEASIMPSISMNSYNIELKDIQFASEKRNNEFHHLFKTISKSEKLIDDFSCALQRDILIQGKLFLSETHISFKSNILGWVTSFTLPIHEIVQLEKKTTAGLFHNGIVVQTLQKRYVFASFLSRDTTFDLILNIWTQLVRGASNIKYDDNGIDLPVDILSREPTIESSYDDDYEDDDTDDDDSDMESGMEKPVNDSLIGPLKHEPTEAPHKENPNERLVTESIIDAPLGKIFQSLFGDNTAFLKQIIEKQKNYKISPITGFNDSEGAKKRSYSYTKPLGGPIGPKETLCQVTETIDHLDYKDYIQVTQNTKSPDVPSGNAFSVYTTFLLSWGPKNSTKLLVYTYVDWTGKSWIKSAVEKGTIDGQKESIGILVDELKNSSGSDSDEKADESDTELISSLPTVGPKQHSPTDNDYTKKQGDIQIVDETLSAPLGTVFQLLFGDDTSYMKSIISAQKNFDLTEITGFQGPEGSKKRNYTYTKPLGGPIGPKETKCNITESIEHYDLNKYIQVLQQTSTPDVPSGGSFTVHTNFYLSWGSNNSTRVLVVTNIVWTGKSWIKGAIEKGTIDGQNESVGILIKELQDVIANETTTGGSKKKRKKSKAKAPISKKSSSADLHEVLKDRPQYNFISAFQGSTFNSFSILFAVCFIFWIILRFFASSSTHLDQNMSLETIGKVNIGGKEYMIIPSINQALSQQNIRDDAEYDIWKWINERSGSKYDDEVKKRKAYNPNVDNLVENQNLRDIIKLAEERIESLKKQLQEV